MIDLYTWPTPNGGKIPIAQACWRYGLRTVGERPAVVRGPAALKE